MTPRISFPAASAGVFEIYRDAAGGFRWRLKAINGEIVAHGESYASRAGAHEGVAAVKRIAPGAPPKDIL